MCTYSLPCLNYEQNSDFIDWIGTWVKNIWHNRLPFLTIRENGFLREAPCKASQRYKFEAWQNLRVNMLRLRWAQEYPKTNKLSQGTPSTKLAFVSRRNCEMDSWKRSRHRLRINPMQGWESEWGGGACFCSRANYWKKKLGSFLEIRTPRGATGDKSRIFGNPDFICSSFLEIFSKEICWWDIEE